MAEDFGTFITARRRELELTLGDVATELDVSPITVSNWSNGQALPDTDQLDALAALLDVPRDDLTRLAGPEVGIPTLEDDGPDIDIPTPDTDLPEIEVPEVEVPPVDPPQAAEDIKMAEPGAAADTSEIDEELAEMIEEQSAEVEVPAFVEAPPEPAPAPPRRRAPAATIAPAVATTLPVTYIEDPKQLMRYRIRWGITVAVLVVMFFILLWAAGGLISALSDIKESVTPGGGS